MWRVRPDKVRPPEPGHYQLIADIGQAALADEPLPELFELVARRLQEVLDVAFCSILELRQDGRLLLVAGAGWRRELIGRTLLKGDEGSQAGYTLRRDEPVVVADFDRETRFGKPLLLDEHKVVSGMSVVIRGKERPYGVLAVYSRALQPFAESDVHVVQALANILGEAVRRRRVEAELQAANAGLERRVFEHSEALLETSVRLRQSEELFRALFDDAATGVVLTDFDGYILETNDAFVQILGFERDELFERRMWDLGLPQDDGFERQLFRELTCGRRPNYQLEKRCLTKAGRVVWVHLAVSLVRDAAGRPLCTLATVQDMTARKEAETALRESQERFQTIFKSGPMATCINTLAEGRILDVNAQFERVMGYRRHEVVGKTVEELNIWLEPDKREALMNTIQGRGYAHNVEVQVRGKSATHMTLLASFERIELAGEEHVLVMFEDISERRRLEYDLADARLKLADLRERERLNLARELHDGAVQQLIGISYGIDQTEKQLLAQPPGAETLAESLQMHRRQVLGVVRQLRSLISNLRPAGLQELGLVATLESIVAQLRGEAGDGAPDIKTQLEPVVAGLSEQTAVCLLRTAQEALRNALKHARAKLVIVKLDRLADGLCLEIRDDGLGFSVPSHLDSLANDDHFGLIGMQERVSSVGGELTLHSSPGQGTQVSVRVPIESEERHA